MTTEASWSANPKQGMALLSPFPSPWRARSSRDSPIPSVSGSNGQVGDAGNNSYPTRGFSSGSGQVRRVIMGYKPLMTVHSVLSIPMGIACILMPSGLLANYGLSLAPMGLGIYQV